MTGFIGLHVGAGSHSGNLKLQYEELCRVACVKAKEMLIRGKSAIDVAVLTTKLLEDSELTNAGIGSNLTWDGTVECDASIMDGTTLNFGAVGAVSCVKNPILLARKILDDQSQTLSLQRVSPCLLVGEGARKLAEKENLTVSPGSLITKKTLRALRKYRRQIETMDKATEFTNNTSKREKIDVKIEKEHHLMNVDEDKLNSEEAVTSQMLDTVGAICVDMKGNLAATCSSGGIALKQSGRVGQAAIFGAGCWAQSTGLNKGVATSVSGTGEDLIKTMLAKEVAMAISTSNFPSQAVHETIKTSFLESPFLTLNSEKLCGLITLDISEINGGEFIWAHTTPSMGIAYMSTKHKNPKVKISQLPEWVRPGSTVIMEGVTW